MISGLVNSQYEVTAQTTGVLVFRIKLAQMKAREDIRNSASANQHVRYKNALKF